MDIGLLVPVSVPYATREFVRALGTRAEACGFHSLWVGEHVLLIHGVFHADGSVVFGLDEPGDDEVFIHLQDDFRALFLELHLACRELGGLHPQASRL